MVLKCFISQTHTQNTKNTSDPMEFKTSSR
uniref:Uncharacterized protein n=1 Tax=Moniliophthora roreri TaxID=221103 RepID=A0A0W0FSC8_MONRR